MLKLDFSSIELEFSAPFGLFSWSGRVQAGPGTYFPAQAWIFHTQESIFHAQNLIFMLGDAWGLVLSCLVSSCLVLSCLVLS